MEARVVREDPPARVRGPADVAQVLRALGSETWPEERFVVLCLDTQNNVRHVQEVTRGTLDTTPVHAREVFWLAVHQRAAALVIAHNHPSGDPSPSPADRATTREMAQAGRVLGIPVRDHVIVGARGLYASLAESGVL